MTCRQKSVFPQDHRCCTEAGRDSTICGSKAQELPQAMGKLDRASSSTLTAHSNRDLPCSGNGTADGPVHNVADDCSEM